MTYPRNYNDEQPLDESQAQLSLHNHQEAFNKYVIQIINWEIADLDSK